MFNGLNTPEFKFFHNYYKLTYKKSCIEFSTSKLLANFRVFGRFRKNVNYKRLKKKL
ncbi:hypothetical protein FWK35_00018652 [Aphis craccivora]|uniref:Uncharacterized protein n=1 Tax=Aphis craccivora TaxID=307492 RepID=A0A6G0ZC50_APHCR|nr:hypothetical protein FWK35_00018652 [Aphis craccivora]